MENGHKREVVVITGASAGVGRATAQEFARRKARIGLLARGQERLEDACDEVEQLGELPWLCLQTSLTPKKLRQQPMLLKTSSAPSISGSTML